MSKNMKKILILLATICCCGCSSNIDIRNTITADTTKIKYYRNDISGCIYSIEIEGHLYIALDEGHGAGIIHAEHCPCKNK